MPALTGSAPTADRLRQRWLRHQWLLLMALAALLLGVFETTPLDLWVSRWFYDAAAGGFPRRHAWLFDVLLHHDLKAASITAGIVAAALAIAGACGAWPSWPRRNALVGLLGLVLLPLATAALKHATQRHCPWSLQAFGGFVPYTSLLQGPSAGVGGGQCFPAGHAMGGYVWLVWAMALRPLDKRGARLAFWLALALGSLMGLGRIAQGAHFLSHTLWSAWLAWAATVALVGLCGAEIRPHRVANAARWTLFRRRRRSARTRRARSARWASPAATGSARSR